MKLVFDGSPIPFSVVSCDPSCSDEFHTMIYRLLLVRWVNCGAAIQLTPEIPPINPSEHPIKKLKNTILKIIRLSSLNISQELGRILGS